MNPDDIPDELVEQATIAHVNHRRVSAGISPVDRLPWAHSSELDRAHVRAALAAVWGDIQALALEDAAERWGEDGVEEFMRVGVTDDVSAVQAGVAWLRTEGERVRGAR